MIDALRVHFVFYFKNKCNFTPKLAVADHELPLVLV